MEITKDCLHYDRCKFSGQVVCNTECGYYAQPLFEGWKKPIDQNSSLMNQTESSDRSYIDFTALQKMLEDGKYHHPLTYKTMQVIHHQSSEDATQIIFRAIMMLEENNQRLAKLIVENAARRDDMKIIKRS